MLLDQIRDLLVKMATRKPYHWTTSVQTMTLPLPKSVVQRIGPQRPEIDIYAIAGEGNDSLIILHFRPSKKET